MKQRLLRTVVALTCLQWVFAVLLILVPVKTMDMYGQANALIVYKEIGALEFIPIAGIAILIPFQGFRAYCKVDGELKSRQVDLVGDAICWNWKLE